MPLVKPELFGPVAMVNILGPEGLIGPYALDDLQKILSISGLKLHIYGKKVSKPQRKMGHITITSSDLESLLAKVQTAKDLIKLSQSSIGKTK
jgi:5-(carboxyamino)imidazole ribonucleotide synthase